MPSQIQSVHLTPPKSHRFLLLDALRGLAALFVVALHFPRPLFPLAPSNGMLAVDFFFCLSGFVIPFSYESRLSQSLSFKDFLVARWIRLYPVYILGSVIGVVSVVAVGRISGVPGPGPVRWLALLAFAICFWPTALSSIPGRFSFPFNGPAWSLFYEIVANTGYALLVKARLARTAIFLLIAAVSLALLGYPVFHHGTVDVGYVNESFSLGFARVAFSFTAGALIYRLYRAKPPRAADRVSRWITPGLVSACLVLVLLSPFQWMQNEFFRLAAIGLCFPWLVYFGALTHIHPRLVRPCVLLGELSYPLYLLHNPLIGFLNARRILLFAAGHPTTAHIASLLLFVLLSWAAVWIAEHFDLPVRRRLVRLYTATLVRLYTATQSPATLSAARAEPQREPDPVLEESRRL